MLEKIHLLRLMQIHDSAFPIGAYTQSFGMETYIQKGKVSNKEELFQYCSSYLWNNLVYGDAILVKEVYQLVKREEWNEIYKLEKLCHGMKIAKESREASLKMGRQLWQVILKLLQQNETGELLQLNNNDIFQEALASKKLAGHYAIVYGWFISSSGIPLEEAILGFIYSTVSSLVHNAVRAIPLGQSDGIYTITRLLAEFEKAVDQVKELDITDIANQAQGIEMASMQHQYLYTRLFIS